MSRQVIEGTQAQGVDEIITYSVTVSPAPTSVTAVKVYDESNDFTDVTTTVMPVGTASINGSTITLPALKLLTQEHIYRIEVKYTDGTNTYEPYIKVAAER